MTNRWTDSTDYEADPDSCIHFDIMKSSTKKNKSNTSLQSSSSSGLTQPSTALCSLQDVLPIDILAPLPLDMHSVVFAKQPSNNAMTPALSNETRMDMLLSLEKAKVGLLVLLTCQVC